MKYLLYDFIYIIQLYTHIVNIFMILAIKRNSFFVIHLHLAF